MIKFIALLAVVLSSTNLPPGSDAFQVSSPIIRPGPAAPLPPPRRVLIRNPPSTNGILLQKSSLHHRMLEGDADAEASALPAEIVEPETNKRSSANDKNAISTWWNNVLGQARSTRPAAVFLSLAIFLLPFFLLTSFPESAAAVQSGGRMGGSFGGSSGGGSSRTYSTPSRSSYSRGYSRGYSSGYYSRPNVIVSPGVSPFYRRPFYSPFYGGPSSGVVMTTRPSFGGVFFFLGFFLVASAVLSNIGNDIGGLVGSALGSNQSVLGPGVSVAEISVALDVSDRDSPNSILSALDRLSRTARTDSRVGLQNLTSQVAIELLRRKSSVVGASTRASHYRDDNKAQREYNNISIQERGKFQRETVSKYKGVDYSSPRDQTQLSEYSSQATVAVITIVLMIDGDSTSKQLSSKVNSIRDVEEALSRIAADSKADSCLRGAEILWTPEERDETLTMKEVFSDYPTLRSV